MSAVVDAQGVTHIKALILLAHEVPMPASDSPEAAERFNPRVLNDDYGASAASPRGCLSDEAKQLVARGAKLIEGATFGGDEALVVVASGGKRDWRDALSRGDVLTRELIKLIGVDAFTSLGLDLCVEGRSNDLDDAAKNAAQLLNRKGRVARMTVLCGRRSVEADARDAFAKAFPGVDVVVQAPPS